MLPHLCEHLQILDYQLSGRTHTECLWRLQAWLNPAEHGQDKAGSLAASIVGLNTKTSCYQKGQTSIPHARILHFSFGGAADVLCPLSWAYKALNLFGIRYAE